MYFFTVHIVLSSASSTNFCHVFCFASFIARLYLVLISLHSSPSISSWLLQYLLRTWLVCFRKAVNLLFHHLLLWGDGRFRGVCFATAFWYASTRESAKSSRF